MIYKIKNQFAFTLVELLVVVVILIILSSVLVLTIDFSSITGKTQIQKKKTDINSIADAYIAKALSGNAYMPLENNDIGNRTIPTPPEGGSYQGLLTEASENFNICAPLDPKDKDINCFEQSNNEKCYCRSSHPKNQPQSPSPVASPSPNEVISSPSPSPSPSETQYSPCQQLFPLPSPTVNIFDSFNRSDSASTIGNTESGQVWTPVKGIWGINSNTAYPVTIQGPGSFPTISYNVVDTGKSDGIVEVTLAKNIQDARIPFRLIDENNNYFVERNGWGYHIEKTLNGNRIELTPRVYNASFADGDRVKIEMRGSCAYISINNSLLLQINDSTFTGTKHGIGTYFDKGMRFDNFSFRYP